MPTAPDQKKQRAWQPISQATLNRLIARLDRLERLSVAPPLELRQTPGGPLLRVGALGLPIALGRTRFGGIAPGGSGVVDVWVRAADGTVNSTPGHVTAWNYASTAVGSVRNVMVAKVGANWEVVWEDCPGK